MSLYPMVRKFGRPAKHAHGPLPWSLTNPAGLAFYTDPHVDSKQLGGAACAAGSPQNKCALLVDEAGTNSLPNTATPGSEPIWSPTGVNAINGRAGLAFDGAASALINSWMPAGLTALTMFVVVRPQVATGFQPILGWQAVGGNAAFLIYTNTGLFQTSVSGTGGPYTTVGTVACNTNWHILTAQYNSATGFISTWVNGVADVVNATGPTGVLITPGFGLGYGFWPNVTFGNIVGSQAMIYTAALNSTDIATVHTKLHADTGI